MEPIGLAISIFGLYGAVKQCITVVSRAQNFSKQSTKLRVRYLIEEIRLQHWAQSWGYPDGTKLDTNLKSFSPALYQVAKITLQEIFTTLQDTAKLKDRYGIESSLGPSLSRSSTAPVGGSQDNLVVSLYSSESKISTLLETSLSSSGITLLRRTMWAINGATKFEALVKDLKEWNDSLACFQPPRRQEFADLALMAALMNPGGDKQNLLPQIMDTLEEEGPSGLAQMASLKRYNEFLEANALKPADTVQRKNLYLPFADFSFNDAPLDSTSQELQAQSFHRRQHGVYHPPSQRDSSQIPVIVEWKILPSDVKQEYKVISSFRIQNIALLLHKSAKRPDGFCTLPCIGIVTDTNGSQGLVFELPQSTNESHLSSNKPYCSLHELLPNMSKKPVPVYEPPLRHRFSLANDLCSAFLIFHSAAVIHKRFSSHDVVFSHPMERVTTTPEGSTSRGLKQPVITGFGFSRPVDDGFGSISIDAIPSVTISNDALAALESSLYAHHSVIGRSAVGFNAKFDLYSLGLVLLEIGLWTRLEELLPSKNTLRKLGIAGPVCSTKVFIASFHHTLISRYLPRLNVTMGDIYEEAVRWCLEKQFEEEEGSGQDSKVQEAFYWNVINKLVLCRV